jgi:hypothetical protein
MVGGPLRMNYHADRRAALLNATRPAQAEAAPLAIVGPSGASPISADNRSVSFMLNTLADWGTTRFYDAGL